MFTCATLCGGTIVITETVIEHLSAHPDVTMFLDEAIKRVSLPTDGSILSVKVEMGRIVGRSGCAPTISITPNDSALFALRLARRKASRVVLDRFGPEVSYIAVIAGPTENPKEYKLYTAFIGEPAPKEPWDPTLTDVERPESIQFWSTHALIYDETVMDEPFQSSWNDILNM